jgi:hypothetical protein
MSRIEATPAELKIVGAKMEALRGELMKHAHAGAQAAGFHGADECALATMMCLIGAAQRYALQSRQHFGIFKAICGDMSHSSADAVIQRSVMEMGPEVSEGGIIMPGQQ